MSPFHSDYAFDIFLLHSPNGSLISRAPRANITPRVHSIVFPPTVFRSENSDQLLCVHAHEAGVFINRTIRARASVAALRPHLFCLSKHLVSWLDSRPMNYPGGSYSSNAPYRQDSTLPSLGLQSHHPLVLSCRPKLQHSYRRIFLTSSSMCIL